MTGAASAYGIARWSSEQQDTLLITDLTGNILDSRHIPPASDHPGPQTLWHTRWCACPGTEWHEDPPGQWTRTVFLMPAAEGNGQA